MDPVTLIVIALGAAAVAVGARVSIAARRAAGELDSRLTAAAAPASDEEREQVRRVLATAHGAGEETAVQDELVWEWVQVRAQRDEWTALAAAPRDGGVGARLAQRAVTERQRRTYGAALKLVFGRVGYEEMLAHLGVEHREAGALITAWNRENAGP